MNIKIIKLQSLSLLINFAAANDALSGIGKFYADSYTVKYIDFTDLLAQLMLHHR